MEVLDLRAVDPTALAYALVRLGPERVMEVLRIGAELEQSGQAEAFRQRERAGQVARRDEQPPARRPAARQVRPLDIGRDWRNDAADELAARAQREARDLIEGFLFGPRRR